MRRVRRRIVTSSGELYVLSLFPVISGCGLQLIGGGE